MAKEIKLRLTKKGFYSSKSQDIFYESRIPIVSPALHSSQIMSFHSLLLINTASHLAAFPIHPLVAGQ